MMTNMCHMILCLSVVNICPVFLCINEKCIYGFQIVIDEAQQRLSFQSLGVCWFYSGHWFRSTSSLSCRAMVLMWLWVSLSLFLLLFFFIFVYWCFFRFVSWKWRWVMTLFRLCDFVWKSWIWFSELNKWIL